MSSTESPARPTRRRAAASPAKEGLQSPVASHPLGQGEPPAAAPRSTAKSRPAAAKQADGRKGGGSAGRGAALAVLVALLAVAGGVAYTRLGGPNSEQLLAQLRSPGELLAQLGLPNELLAWLGLSAPGGGPPRKQQRRDPRDSPLAGGVPLIPQPVPRLPPLPPITQQEIEAFEQVGLRGRVEGRAGNARHAGSAALAPQGVCRQRRGRQLQHGAAHMQRRSSPRASSGPPAPLPRFCLAPTGHGRALRRARVALRPRGAPPGAGAGAGAGGGRGGGGPAAGVCSRHGRGRGGSGGQLL